MEVLEILGKRDQSGHRAPMRMSKTTGFPGRNALSPKRGGWQGGSKMQNPREKRGSKWSNPVHFERILVQIARVWAHLSWFSSNPCSKAVQNDHISPRWSCATIEAFPASLFTPAGNNDGTGLRDGPVGVPHSICQDLGMSAAA